jgi:hypothetical protein
MMQKNGKRADGLILALGALATRLEVGKTGHHTTQRVEMLGLAFSRCRQEACRSMAGNATFMQTHGTPDPRKRPVFPKLDEPALDLLKNPHTN